MTGYMSPRSVQRKKIIEELKYIGKELIVFT